METLIFSSIPKKRQSDPAKFGDPTAAELEVKGVQFPSDIDGAKLVPGPGLDYLKWELKNSLKLNLKK